MCNFAGYSADSRVRTHSDGHGQCADSEKNEMMDTVTEEKITELDRRISEASSVVISTHTHPDGDAVGSSTALALYLAGRGKSVKIIFPDPCPENLGFAIGDGLSGMIADRKEEAVRALENCSLLISVDYNSPSRTDILETEIRKFDGFRILIDHHIAPEEDFYDLIFSQCEVSSSCELLYDILLGMPEIGGRAERLGKETGTALMLGMTTDSNNFANSTYPSTLKMAGELLAAGVDRDALLGKLYGSYRENRFRFMGYFLEKMKITPEGVAYAVMSSEEIRKYGIRDGESEGFVNMPLGIEKVRMSIFLKEEEKRDRLRVSVRSKRGVSANRFAARYFNGGGHELAAGGRLSVPSDISGPEAAPSYIEKCAEDFFGKR